MTAYGNERVSDKDMATFTEGWAAHQIKMPWVTPGEGCGRGGVRGPDALLRSALGRRWKAGDTAHIVYTWGPEGDKLYVNGKRKRGWFKRRWLRAFGIQVGLP